MKNKVVLITGSSRGIGLSVAEKFLRTGSRVVLNCDKSVFEMEEAAVKLKNIGPDIICARADVSLFDECERMFCEISDKFGAPDVLINNAGVSNVGLIQDADAQEIKKLIEINLCGAIYCSKLAAAGMIKKKSGAIINISSVWGGAGASCEAVYSASKGGLNALTKSLAKELGPSGVRVNAIACGVVDTGMNNWLTEDERRDLTEKIPLGRFGMPDEIASLAYFLASDDSSYINGQIINADGGMI